MRDIILFICLALLGVKSHSQDPDPELFQVWYLYEMHFELEPSVIVEGWNPTGEPGYPQISPYITFLEPLDFEGFGICNAFEGSLLDLTASGNGSGCATEVASLSSGSEDCGFFENDFEQAYFQFFEPNFASVCYQITEDGDGFFTLTLTGSIFSTFIFRNNPILSISDNVRKSFTIFPNPTSEELSVVSETGVISKVDLYNLSGQKIHTDSSPSNMDLTGISSGMYLLAIYFDDGIIRFEKLIIH